MLCLGSWHLSASLSYTHILVQTASSNHPHISSLSLMPSSLLFPCPPPPSVSFQSPLLKSALFFSNTSRNNYNNIQQGKLVLLATLSSSTGNSSERAPLHTLSLVNKTDRLCPKEVSDLDKIGISFAEKNDGLPIKEEEHKNLNFEKRNSRLQVQNYVDRIRALPTSERIEILDIFEKDCRFQNQSDFNDLLMALVMADEPELALKQFSNLSSYGLVSDSWTFSIMIRCYCKKNDPTEAKRVLDLMMEKGFRPNVATFTVLINSFCRRGRLQKAFEVFEVMGRTGCKPTLQTYNCLIKGLCYVGKVEEAYELLMNIKKSRKKPDIYSYTAVMDGFCKVGRSDEAMELLNEALEIGLTPTAVTFNTLFNGYCKEGRALEGISLLKKMKERNCMPDYISYSTLLHGLLKWGKVRSGLQIYKEMVGIGFEVDERIMNTLLRGLCRRSWKEEELLKDAYEVFEKMNNRVSAIYPCTYDLVIQTLCIGKEMDKALVNLRKIVRIGYSPRMITFNSVIRALCIGGKVDEALLVLVLVYEGSRIPSRISYNLLIDEFNRQGRLLGACNVYGAALKLGVIPHRKPRECSTY